MIDKSKPIPFYIQLKDYILEAIRDGHFKQGDKLPTEKELMDQFKLGRVTVRAALLELEHEGYIEKRHGIGTFVSNRSRQSGFEPLISLSFSLKSMGIKAENKIILNEEIPMTQELLEQIKLTDATSVQHLLRIREAEGEPIAIEHSYFDSIIYKQLEGYNLEESLADLLLNKINISVIKIDQSMRIRKPTEYEKEVLLIEDTNMVMELTRWLYTEENVPPFFFVHFVLLADHISYTFDNFIKK